MTDQFTIILNANIFIRRPDLTKDFTTLTPDFKKYENRELKPGDVQEIENFKSKKTLHEQQEVFKLGEGEKVIRSFCTAFQQLNTNFEVAEYILYMLDGIYEDERSRASIFAKVQRAYHDQVDIIGSMINFLVVSDIAKIEMRDTAAHLAAVTIGAIDYKYCEDSATKLLNWLLVANRDNNMVSHFGFVSALMYLLKHNDIVRQFYDNHGIRVLTELMIQELDDMQTCYNIIVCLWIISFKHYAVDGFENPKIGVSETVARVLHLYNREKIIRITLMLFSNLVGSEKCLELMLEVNLLTDLHRLMNRHWVDKQIPEMVQKVEQQLVQNYKELTSFEKWKKQVLNGVLKWGPVHSEVFWNEYHGSFGSEAALACIRQLVELIGDQDVTTRAIACYDVGEFARVVPLGSKVLDKLEVKKKIMMQLGGEDPVVKEQALVALQKIMAASFKGGITVT